MDIFKFNNPLQPTQWGEGEILNGLKTKLWVERYRNAGEFKLVANADSRLREKLPLGTFVSHTDTKTVMIVENHEITSSRDEEAEITVTGRSFETYLAQRVAGAPLLYAASPGPDYILGAAYVWNQANVMINAHIRDGYANNGWDVLPYVYANAFCYTRAVEAQPVETRIIKRGDLYTRTLELLALGDVGIKATRPGTWGPSGTHLSITMHNGVDKTATVVFAFDTGEIESADYLWSNKRLKNVAHVKTKWLESLMENNLASEGNYNRRTLLVDASDLDQHISTAPSGQTVTDLIYAMRRRGEEALAAQNLVTLTKAEASRDATRYTYRTDYDVGDIITVRGEYNTSAKMRITEYVEIEDQTGFHGYPTLELYPY